MFPSTSQSILELFRRLLPEPNCETLSGNVAGGLGVLVICPIRPYRVGSDLDLAELMQEVEGVFDYGEQ